MPTAYELMSDQELAQEITRLEAEAEHLRSLGLKLDMARGKPSPEQTALSHPMLDVLNSSTEMAYYFSCMATTIISLQQSSMQNQP